MNFDLLFDKAKAKNIEALQIHLEELEQIDFDVFNGELDKHQIADTRKLSIKGIYNGKMGKMSTESLDEANMDQWIDAIIDSAKAIESKDEVFIYEGDTSYKDIPELATSNLDNLSKEEKLKLTFDLNEKIKNLDEKVKISQSFYGQAVKKVTLKNSKGLNLTKKVNSALLGAMAIVKTDDDSRQSLDYVQTDNPKDFNIDEMAEGVVKRATSMLGAKSLKSDTYNILLENRASATLLSAFMGMFKAESVQKGMSKLQDKVNQKIANDNVTLIDDPFMLKSTRSGAFDDEGVATRYKEIVKNGTLTNYLYDLKTAKKDNTDSTGNAFSGSIQHTNFYFKNGDSDVSDMIGSMKEGLLITSVQGAHSGTNPISGDFSLQATGYMIKNGKVDRPIALFTIAGNYLKWFNQISDIGNDLKFGFNFIGSPTLKIDNVVVSGNE